MGGLDKMLAGREDDHASTPLPSLPRSLTGDLSGPRAGRTFPLPTLTQGMSGLLVVGDATPLVVGDHVAMTRGRFATLAALPPCLEKAGPRGGRRDLWHSGTNFPKGRLLTFRAAHKALGDKEVKIGEIGEIGDDLHGPGAGVKWFNLMDPDANLIHQEQAYVRESTHPLRAVSRGSSLPCLITEENHTVAKAAFLQQLELYADVVREGSFATSHNDWCEEQLTLIDQSCSKGMGS